MNYNKMPIPTGKAIIDAYEDTREVYTKTEIRTLDWISRQCGTEVIGKFENQQRTGSFKFRGAYYRVKNRNTKTPIIVASAGNHGLAIAEVSKLLGVKATICIPTTANSLKKERLSTLGISIIQQGASTALSYAFT